jgi:hypothetical protein
MSRLSISIAITAVTTVVMLAMPAPAAANPKKLPFSYGAMTMHKGGLELENYVDAIPVRVARERPDGTLEGVWGTRYQLQTEMEYGLTERLELGFYLAWRQGASADTPVLRFEGMKQRVRFRISDPASWPIGLATYFEIAEFHNELEIEEKVIVSWSRGPLELVANLWVEQEYYFADDAWKFLYNPTLGASWEASPNVSLGLEYWARGRFDDADESNAADDNETGNKARHYLGPTVTLQKGEYWMALGAYVRLETGEIAVGDPFGRFWVRVIVGLGL